MSSNVKPSVNWDPLPTVGRNGEADAASQTSRSGEDMSFKSNGSWKRLTLLNSRLLKEQ